MTRGEFLQSLEFIDDVQTRKEFSVHGKWLAANDLEQRATIKRQAQEIARLREALKVLLEHLEDDCRLDHHGYCQNHFVTIPCVYKQAQQALKESSAGSL